MIAFIDEHKDRFGVEPKGGGPPIHCLEPPDWQGPLLCPQRPQLPGRGVRGPPAQVTAAPG